MGVDDTENLAQGIASQLIREILENVIARTANKEQNNQVAVQTIPPGRHFATST